MNVNDIDGAMCVLPDSTPSVTAAMALETVMLNLVFEPYNQVRQNKQSGIQTIGGASEAGHVTTGNPGIQAIGCERGKSGEASDNGQSWLHYKRAGLCTQA